MRDTQAGDKDGFQLEALVDQAWIAEEKKKHVRAH